MLNFMGFFNLGLDFLKFEKLKNGITNWNNALFIKCFNDMVYDNMLF